MTNGVFSLRHDAMPQHGAAVGIDLGSSSCRIGLWRDGDVLIVPNDRGFFEKNIRGRSLIFGIIGLIGEILRGMFGKSCNGCWMKMIWKGYQKKT